MAKKATKLGLSHYITYGLNAQRLRTATSLLLHDKGLPHAEWTKAHAKAVRAVEEAYPHEPVQDVTKARPEKDAWMTMQTFRKGSDAQGALSRICALITGRYQKEKRAAAKARRDFAKLEGGAKLKAQVAMMFARIEKRLKAQDITAAEKKLIEKHATHIKLVAAKPQK